MSGRMKLAIIGYAVTAMITFGHSAANLSGDCDYHSCNAFDRVSAGTVSAIFWPLYWSWEAWS